MSDLYPAANHHERWYATAQNQYGLEIGSAEGATETIALSNARDKAKLALQSANPNWKWRISRVRARLIDREP